MRSNSSLVSFEMSASKKRKTVVGPQTSDSEPHQLAEAFLASVYPDKAKKYASVIRAMGAARLFDMSFVREVLELPETVSTDELCKKLIDPEYEIMGYEQFDISPWSDASGCLGAMYYYMTHVECFDRGSLRNREGGYQTTTPPQYWACCQKTVRRNPGHVGLFILPFVFILKQAEVEGVDCSVFGVDKDAVYQLAQEASGIDLSGTIEEIFASIARNDCFKFIRRIDVTFDGLFDPIVFGMPDKPKRAFIALYRTVMTHVKTLVVQISEKPLKDLTSDEKDILYKYGML